MRLTAMKLSGFKSFVEPTTISFPTNLMAIVGPNGCGKSNIIDAVRWVMGESSARQLRGESMSDVIFSGSSSRKPVATATVELIFDNSSGRAGGEYANYAEISVKRQVTRDGQSVYWLNGTRCRRKDITDLFLGTGLGPRSYAIIEQGMISQIVEARPEELRAFLEEAAGISRYKERRRETENRIRHTRDNLDRLGDLREEVDKQLARLKRQANAAERYKKLQARYREDEARLLALRWRELKAQTQADEKALREVENQLQAALSAQRKAEKELEVLRQTQHAARESVAGVQGELYEVASAIARVEQAIEHQQEIRQRQQKEHSETETQLNELKQHLVLDRTQVEQSTTLLASHEPQLEKARQDEAGAQAELERLEADLEAWRQRWQKHQQTASSAAGRAELLRQQISHLDDRMSQAAARLGALDQQSGEAAQTELTGEKSSLSRKTGDMEGRLESIRSEVESDQKRLHELRAQIEKLRNELESGRARRHQTQARIESLQLLNRAAGSEDKVNDWLKNQGLDARMRVLKQIRVADPEWNVAVEAVLADWLQAIQVDDVAASLDGDLPPSGLLLSDRREVSGQAGTLAAKVEHAGAVGNILTRVRCAPDLDAARRILPQLGEAESVITPRGLWLGPGWFRQPAGVDAEQGVIEREQQIRALGKTLLDHDQHVSELEKKLESSRQERKDVEQQLATRREQLAAGQREHARLAGQLSSLDSRLAALERARQSAVEEIEKLNRRQREDTEAVGTARRKLEEALGHMKQSEAEREPLQKERQHLEAGHGEARKRLADARKRREELALKVGSAKAGLDSLRQSIKRMDNQVGQLQARYIELSEALARGDQPVDEQRKQRDQLLDQRLEVEKRLAEARTKLEALEAEWRKNDEARQQARSSAEKIRTAQSERQLALRETQLKAENIADRVNELGASLEELLEQLPEDAQTAAWQQALEALEKRIRRLEPVNLAAIDEYETESERKEYLDRQNEDLVKALETLEKAISRIDRDTRTRFRETFEHVNKNLEVLFPRLFGGGHAHLEMVGDDWLSAGVAIMARPPGKRVARIHLLSGGEKALTAVSFVFSIFNLNPAPFCLLDEVDAPLDDANVGRFSDMVREMSDQVQFLVVTHNKVTMETAHQMLGVTMREPGVSRMVSVDLDHAVALAES